MKQFIIAAAVLISAAPAIAAPVTFDFQTGGTAGSFSGSGFSNRLDMSASGLDLSIRGYANTDTGSTFERAQIRRFSTGLGLCNQDEGLNCGDPAHQVDNSGPRELALFSFDQTVEFLSVTINPFGLWDRDTSYVAGDIIPADILGETISQLNALFGGFTHSYDNVSANSLTINFAPGLIGEDLFFGALVGTQDTVRCGLFTNRRCDLVDRFKIESLTVRKVPEPASLALFGLGALALGAARRRRG
jgi:PEP-CTERM motif